MSEKDEAFGAEVARTVYAELMALSRKPFTRQLAKILGCAPTTEAIQAFANKNPDRWAQSIAIFAPLAGIVKDTPINVNIFNVKDMSDSALIARARELKVPVPPEMLGIMVEAEALPPIRGRDQALPRRGDEAEPHAYAESDTAEPVSHTGGAPAPEFVSHGETLNAVEPDGADTNRRQLDASADTLQQESAASGRKSLLREGATEGPSAPSSLPEGGADAPEGKP